MGYLILVMVLTFVQALPPTPSKDQVGTEGKTTASSTAPLIKGDGQNQIPKESQETIKVTEMPPVTVVPPKRDWVDWGYWVFSGLLVVVGGLQVWLLLRTFGAIEKQANAMVNSERAWVVVELVPLVTKFGDGRWYRFVGKSAASLSDEEIARGEHLKYKLKLTNMGRTPAHIFAFHILYQCLDEGVRHLPENAGSHFAEAREFEHILAGGASGEIMEPIIDVYLRTKDTWEAISKFEKTAVFSGWVKYRHMFSDTDDFYAPFCYAYTASQEKLTRVGRYSTKEEQRKNETN